MKTICLILLSALFFGAANARAAEHCLVVQAIASAAYEARMQLLVGTDDIFSTAWYAEQAASKAVNDKYRALFAARNLKGNQENPENHGGAFHTPAERVQFFQRWGIDIQALEADEQSEIAVFSHAFERAMATDPNPATRRRLARIHAQYAKEANAPCYWGEPK